MSETAYWVWLQCALGEGAAVQPLLEEFGSAKAVYDANIMEWRMTPALTKYQVQHLESTPLSAADKVLSTCKQQGWQILHYDHPAARWESTVPPIRARCWPAAPPLRCWAAVWVPGI